MFSKLTKFTKFIPKSCVFPTVNLDAGNDDDHEDDIFYQPALNYGIVDSDDEFDSEFDESDSES
jgi:hypothetical protein